MKEFLWRVLTWDEKEHRWRSHGDHFYTTRKSATASFRNMKKKGIRAKLETRDSTPGRFDYVWREVVKGKPV